MSAKQKIRDLMILTIINIIYSLVYVVFCYDSDHWYGMDIDKESTLWDKLFNRFYFSIVTLSTVGYGDITPRTKTARMLVMIQMAFNINSILRVLLV